jgi:mRNA interferase MazF
MTIAMQPKLFFRRNDVVLVLFPNSSLTSAKIRPALIIQADNIQTDFPQVVIAMITSQMNRAGHPSRVTVLLNSAIGQQSGLLTDSVVMTDNLATVALSAIQRVIGVLPAMDIDNALKHTFGLELI